MALVLSTMSLLDLATPAVAGAAVSPVVAAGQDHVTADSLPTVQVNGVVWDQAIIGDTVYAVGEFTSARPAGAAPGTNETPRSNILAYDITTGALVTSFAPTLNRQAKAITASPDGSRLYVGGDFTNVSGLNRYRLAAIDPVSGAPIAGFDALLDYRVNAIVATDTTVYAGGSFNYAGNGLNSTRSRLAAFSADNGSLLPWNPSANGNVFAMVMSPDQSKVFVGGNFTTMGGVSDYGMSSVDATTGDRIEWSANQVVRNAQSSSAILSLETDGTSIYGAGYTYSRSTGNLEGTFSANPDTGEVNWVQDCHGDTYSVAPVNGYLYSASHAHYCGNVGGFAQSDPWPINMRHARSSTTNATGTIQHEPWGYTNWEGTPSPSMTNWFPDWQIGSYTGQNQATWTVTGNSEYVVYGGEFLRVNNGGQQGLARFAVRGVAPAQDGPRLNGAAFQVSVKSTAAGTVRIVFPANYDRDSLSLTYRIARNGDTGNPIHTTTVDSTFWDRPTVGFTDTGLTPGQTYSYRVFAEDSDGNQAASETTSVTVATTGSPSPYADAVMADDARIHWRLGDGSGASNATDAVSTNTATVGSSVSMGQSGALLNDPDTSASFGNSSSSRVVQDELTDTYDNISVEAWVKTNTSRGGRILGFGNSKSGTSSKSDRVLYMANNGSILFGADQSGKKSVSSASGYNDNQWHHIVGTVGSDGMHLYVDGVRVQSRSDVTGGEAYNGYWRVGADTLSGWPARPSRSYLSGQIDEAAIYRTVLSADRVAAHYTASGRTIGLPPGPADAYGAAVHAANPYLFYRLDESGGSTANDSGIRDFDGTYFGSVGRNASGVVAGNAAAQFNGSGHVAAVESVYDPSDYTLETWFNTTTTTGGALIGLGSSRNGTSSTTDRQVYMRNDGRLVFSVKDGGANAVVSADAFNDGEWHHVVATQGDHGTALYVDSVLAGTTEQQTARAYTGYWRIGGDSTNGGSSSNYFSGRLDEAAVYDRVLDPATVTAHFLAAGGQLPNIAPTAAFTSTTSFLTASVDASGSTDPDGTITAYAWDFGDGNTATGATATHTYAAAGTYTVALTVTDDRGDTNTTTRNITVAANQSPAASFTSTTDFLTASVDASGSTDPDGTITAYDWDFGDGNTATGATATHTYAAAGTYTVALTVTDDQGATATTDRQVTVAPNHAPVASFTTSAAALVVSTDATASSDSDGSITAYDWDFGDGNTATGVAATHAYAAAGTYTITLTVTDDQGAVGTTTNTVTVAGAAVYVDDTFDRTTSNGFGSAPTGGSYSYLGGPSNFAVDNGQGHLTMPTAGVSRGAMLSPNGVLDAETTVDISLDKAPTAGVYMGTVLRKTGNSEYRFRVRVRPGKAFVQMLRVVNNGQTSLAPTQVIDVDYTPGMVLHLKFRAVGSGTTLLSGKAWFDGPEPADWQIETNDSTPELQNAGMVGVHSYISGASTEAPNVMNVDNFKVVSTHGAGVPNLDPVAAFAASSNFLDASVDASTSSDPDGVIAAYLWDFGDGATAAGVTANHTYAAAGTYPVTLAVIDDQGAVDQTTQNVTVTAPPANVAPTADFAATTSFLTADVDGSASSDPDGNIVSYDWDFGDGATATGVTANHTYATAGTYTITLTVTDDRGGTGTATLPTTVDSPQTALAADLFERIETNGLGVANLGGGWALSGTAANFAVDGTQAQLTLPASGVSRAAFLPGTSFLDSDSTVDFTLDKDPTNGGVFMGLSARKVGNSEYRVRVRVRPDRTNLELVRVLNGSETTVTSQNVPGAIYSAGTQVHIRFRIVGDTNPTISAKTWFGADAEPANWSLQYTDTTAPLTAAGSAGVHFYIAGSSTNAPVVASVDNLLVNTVN